MARKHAQGLIRRFDLREKSPRRKRPADRSMFRSLRIEAIEARVLLSAAGQLGDLVESCFKRDAGSKDSGAVIPQFGGILDLIDSPLVAVPVGWFLLTKVWDVV